MARTSNAHADPSRARGARFDFRVDAETKRLVERAARLERRSLTDYCLTVLSDAARHTVQQHSALVLSERERAAFFDALVNPPKPNTRLRRALRREQSRVAR